MRVIQFFNEFEAKIENYYPLIKIFVKLFDIRGKFPQLDLYNKFFSLWIRIVTF